MSKLLRWYQEPGRYVWFYSGRRGLWRIDRHAYGQYELTLNTYAGRFVHLEGNFGTLRAAQRAARKAEATI